MSFLEWEKTSCCQVGMFAGKRFGGKSLVSLRGWGLGFWSRRWLNRWISDQNLILNSRHCCKKKMNRDLRLQKMTHTGMLKLLTCPWRLSGTLKVLLLGFHGHWQQDRKEVLVALQLSASLPLLHNGKRRLHPHQSGEFKLNQANKRENEKQTILTFRCKDDNRRLCVKMATRAIASEFSIAWQSIPARYWREICD